MPENGGGRSAGQSELRLSRRTGKSQPAERSHNSAHGREISCALTGEATRSRCLSCRRAGRHRPPGDQRAHRCRFHPRPGHRGDEPARHHVLGAGAYLRVRPTTSPESFLASASIPRRPSAPIWRRRKPATANSPPPAPTSAPTIRPRVPLISPTSVRCSAIASVECLRDFLWLLPCADAHARPPGRHPQRRPRFGLADDLHRRRKLVERARRLRQPLPGLRGGNGLQRGPSPSRRNLHRTGQQARGRAADDNRQRPGHRQRPQSRPRRRGAGRLAAQPELWRAHAPSRAESDRWARCRPPRFHRGDRQGSGRPGAAIRSGCPCPRLRAGLGVSCREDYPFATPEDLAAAGREAFPDYPASVQGEGVGGWAYFNEDCRDVWKVPAAPEAMHQPVESAIPTLLISGSFDTLTSLAGAEAAAARLSNATIISIPGIGHFVSPWSPCAQAVIVSFLADPSAPDTSCVGELKPPSFTPF